LTTLQIKLILYIEDAANKKGEIKMPKYKKAMGLS
jgi:hypothetical protein